LAVYKLVLNLRLHVFVGFQDAEITQIHNYSAGVETKFQAPFKSYLNTENPGDCNQDILELDIST